MSLAYCPLGFFKLDLLILYEAFLWTLVFGKRANKVELYLENDWKCNYRMLGFFSISFEGSFINFFCRDYWMSWNVQRTPHATKRHQTLA